jgi:hypothetical protein
MSAGHLPGALAAPFYLAAGMLLAAGPAKVLRPRPAADATRAAGIPGGTPLARAVGIAEAAAGAAALLAPGPVTAGLVAGLYLAFAAFLVRLLRRGGSAGCGCAGSRETPPSWLHVALDLVAVGVAAAVAVGPLPWLGAALAASPLRGVPLAVGLLGAGLLVRTAVGEVPRAWASYRPRHEEHTPAAGPRPLELIREPRP